MSQTWAAEQGSDARHWVDPGDMNTAMHRAGSQTKTLLSGLIQQMSLKFYLLGFRRITGRERARFQAQSDNWGRSVTGQGSEFHPDPDPRP